MQFRQLRTCRRLGSVCRRRGSSNACGRKCLCSDCKPDRPAFRNADLARKSTIHFITASKDGAASGRRQAPTSFPRERCGSREQVWLTTHWQPGCVLDSRAGWLSCAFAPSLSNAANPSPMRPYVARASMFGHRPSDSAAIAAQAQAFHGDCRRTSVERTARSTLRIGRAVHADGRSLSAADEGSSDRDDRPA